MAKIKIIDVLTGDWPGHVGAVYEVAKFGDLNSVVTTCGRHFYQGEYEVVEGSVIS